MLAWIVHRHRAVLVASAFGQLCVDLEAASCILDPSLAWVDVDWCHVMLETVAGSNPAGATLLGMLAGWTTSNATKGGHCGLSTKEPKP